MTRLLCLNTDAGTIPAGGCVRLSEVNAAASSKAEIQYTAIKPEGGTNFYFINGPIPTLTGKTFFVDDPGRITRALVDAGASFGDTVGPASGSWTMDADGTGFEVIGDLGADGLTPVLRQGSGGGGVEQMAFIITDADCVNGLVYTDDANIKRFTGCDTPSGIDGYSGLYEIEDYFGFISELTETELIGARAMAIRWHTYPGCDAHWELLMVEWIGGC